MKIFVKEYFNSPVGDMRLLLILLYLIHLLYNSILNYYKELPYFSRQICEKICFTYSHGITASNYNFVLQTHM